MMIFFFDVDFDFFFVIVSFLDEFEFCVMGIMFEIVEDKFIWFVWSFF